ncbi:MAG: MBL fold metallo-hydrolase, partial [Pseudomonadota bacterium]
MSDPFDRRPDVRYGVAEEVAPTGAPRIRRVTCQNPSPMTFTGTQSYLVGEGEVALIDPGPDLGAHRAALLAALEPGERIGAVLVTHTHIDHSPGAKGLGAEVLAFGRHGTGRSARMAGLEGLGGGEGGDRAFQPDRCLAEGDRVPVGDAVLEVLHTPGHLSTHLSFALAGTGVVFTGDTVMGWATTLVSPPDGDMADFMASLGRLGAREDRLYLPGHGHPVTEPAAMVAHQIAHREARRDQVLAALEDGPATAEALAQRIYRDVDPALLPAAARNVLATLIWQMDAGEVGAEPPLRGGSLFS